MIDTHVYFRDWEQSYKETIKHGLSVAERIGLSGVFDMPNTSPPITTRELIERRLADADKIKFKGKLHICHVSVPKSVQLIEKARKSNIKISCGVTPHHCLLNLEMIPPSEEGLIYKVNPPLRDKKSSIKMLELLSQGKIDWIETDHAPHTLEEKTGKALDAKPGLPFYPHFINILRKKGFTEEQIRNLTHCNIENIFGIKLIVRDIEPNLNLHTEYEVDIYKEIRGKNE